MRTHLLALFLILTAGMTSQGATIRAKPPTDSLFIGPLSTTGDVMGRAYTTSLPFSAVTNAPLWFPTRDNLPFPPGKADRIAAAALAGTLDSASGWEREDIVLMEFPDCPGKGYWIYQISYRGPSYRLKNVTSAVASGLTFYVTMKGEVFSPKPDP